MRDGHTARDGRPPARGRRAEGDRSINLKSLAALLGLSQTTVSRALNGFPEVSEATRARVREAAREHDYRPSSRATALATGRAHAVAHIVPLAEAGAAGPSHRMMNPHFSDFLAGAGASYAQAGYELLLRLVDPADEARITADLVRRGRVDGVVIHGPRVDEPRIAAVRALGVPFIVHGRTLTPGPAYAHLDVDNEHSMHTLTRRMVEAGHRRIGLVNGMETMTFALARRRGYEAALREAAIAPDAALVLSADMTEPYGRTATHALMARRDPPTALLYASVLAAMGGLRALAERGLRVGADVSVAMFDDDLSFLRDPAAGPEGTYAGLSAARSSLSGAGRRAAEMLLAMMDDPDAPPLQEVWQAEFVWTASVAVPPSPGRA